MKKVFNSRSVAAAAVLALSPAVFASEYGESLIYFGAGPARQGSRLESDATPLSLGYLRVSDSADLVLGLDVSGEGTMLDSTWGQNRKAGQATAYNFLIGRNLARQDSSRLDAALLIGMREQSADCQASYLGYQCYADTPPDRRYGLNYGVVLTWTYKRMMLGLRATGESTQALVGLRF